MEYEDDALELVCDDEELPLLLQESLVGAPLRGVLPLPRPVSSALSLCSPAVVKDPSSEVDAGGGGIDNSSAPPAETSSGADRVGSYFGYNGVDAHVPKAAYDALLQRVRSLETSLGIANREIRAETAALEEHKRRCAALEQQVHQKQQLLQLAEERECLIARRERELDAREQSLDAMARSQRKFLRGKSVSSEGDEMWLCVHCHLASPAAMDGQQGGAARRRGSTRGREEEVVDPKGLLPRIPGLRHTAVNEPVIPSRSQTSLGFSH
jgi:hypothetical protein